MTVAAAMVLGFGGRFASKSSNSLFLRPSKAQTPVNFVEETITRRIYFTNNDNYWGSEWSQADMEHLYVYAWQYSDDTNKTTVEAVCMMSDVRQNENTVGGLWYADITFSGAGDRVGVIIKTTEDWSGAQSADVCLPTLWSTSPDVIYLNSGKDGSNHRNASIGGFTGMSDGNMAYFLRQYKTCDAAYSNGYNAYPQIMKDFCPTGKIYEGSTVVTDYDYEAYVNNGKSYENLEQTGSTTITEKIEALRDMYTSDGYSVSNYNVPLAFSTQDGYVADNKRDRVTLTYESISDNTYVCTYSALPDVPKNAIGIKFNFTNNNGTRSAQINVDIGTSGATFASHLYRTGEGDDYAPYDWFNDGQKRAQYNVGANGTRECTFLFNQSEGVIDGILIFLDSCWADLDPETEGAQGTTHLDGSVTFSNAQYIFPEA